MKCPRSIRLDKRGAWLQSRDMRTVKRPNDMVPTNLVMLIGQGILGAQ